MPSSDESRSTLSKEEIEDLRLEAEELLEDGHIENVESNYEEALGFYKSAFEIFKRIESIKGIIQVHNEIGMILVEQRKYDEASKALLHALELAEEHHFFQLKATSYHFLGILYSNKSDAQKALYFQKKSLEISQKMGNRAEEAKILGALGNIFAGFGELPKALEYFNQGLEISRQIGQKKLEAVLLGNIGQTHQHLGEFQNAIQYYEQAARISKQIANKKGESIVLQNLGNVYHLLGEFQTSAQYYEQAIQISEQIGDKKTNCAILDTLGYLYTTSGEHEKAIQCYEQTLEIAKQIGNRKSEGSSYAHIGYSHKIRKEYKKAIQYFEQALELAKEIEAKQDEGIALGNLGDIFIILNSWKKAEEYLQQSITICKLSLPLAAGVFLGSLAWVYAQQGKHKEAHSLLQEGESLVSIWPLEYGKFLCKKAKILHLANQTAEAEKILNQAKQIALKIKVSAKSELPTTIKEAEEFISQNAEPT